MMRVLLLSLLLGAGTVAARDAKEPPAERARGKIEICSWNIYVLGRSKREISDHRLLWARFWINPDSV